jgi:serine/threonine-protein kinase
MREGELYCLLCGAMADDAEHPDLPQDPQNPVPAELLGALRRDLRGQYQIGELLGRGGMSFVFLAHEVELNRQVAIKVLPFQLLTTANAADRFEREGRIAASLDHPHLVPIFRVGATKTFLWYTMKRVRGRSLERIIAERGRLPLAEVLAVIEQVGSALQHAHHHGVVHRDVKPANVLIEDSGLALVCDFGVSRAVGSDSLTQTGGSPGTPRYMAPEQFEGQPVDGRCDQYSLAILAWQALTGALPFDGDTVGELIRQHLLEPPPRVSGVRADVPKHVSDAVHRAMSKNPADRFPDIATFVSALQGSVDTATPLPPNVIWWPDESPERLLRRRRQVVIVVGVIVGFALAGAGIWSSLRPSPAAPPPLPVPSPVPPRAALPAFTPAETPARRRVIAPASARFSLSTQPTGILFVDGKRIRSTPIVGFTLPPGQHHVQVRRDGFAPFDTVFVAAPGEEIKWTRRSLPPLSPSP